MNEKTGIDGEQLRLTAVIPARNEGFNVGVVLRALPDCVDEVVLVDGHSVDDTIAAARDARPDVRVVQQSRTGKGNALAAGFEAARGRYILMIDADGSMDPREIESFVAALDAGADYAKGSRYAPGGGSTDITRLRNLGNRSLNRVTNLLFGTRFSDLCYGYNAFTRECLGVFDLPPAHSTSDGSQWGDGFEIETLINVRVAKAALRIAEVPSFEHRRLSGDSNLRTFRDGMRVLVTLVRERCNITASERRSLATSEARQVDRVVDRVIDLRDADAPVRLTEAS